MTANQFRREIRKAVKWNVPSKRSSDESQANHGGIEALANFNKRTDVGVLFGAHVFIITYLLPKMHSNCESKRKRITRV